MRFEIRANLDGMTLSGIDELSKDEARSLGSQDVDPLDEELGTQTVTPAATPVSTVEPAPVQASLDPLVDTTPFGVQVPSAKVAAERGPDSDDAALFGLLWPLEDSMYLDSTIDRLTFRTQVARLKELGFVLNITTQKWSRKGVLQAA
jgi:hypothetical protein